MPAEDESESRRNQITALLTRRGPLTLAELADALGLSKTSLRPQLDRLVLQGWLERSRRREGPGRPADVFHVSSRSRERSSWQTTSEFAKLLLEELADEKTLLTASSVVDGAGRRMFELLRPIVGEGSAAQRAQRLADYLSERGILSDVDQSGDSVTLQMHTCPYVGLSADHTQVCRMHKKVIAELLGGSTCKHRRRDNQSTCCEFHVEARAERARSGRREQRRSARPKKGPKNRR